ncbi:MAG TPA: amino acid adenylation domain-containing protein, partial [Candidatus Deferrimicrobium sp.]|nr:amino acid adenylation domain-containing protein [Candidatus Deferrimicrobium sp.]
MSKVIPTAAVTLAANQRKKEKAYWLHRLAGHPVKDSFPVDHETADPVPSYRLETAGFSMPEEISRPLIELSKESSERMFIILMTGIFILLRKYAGVKDIIVGIPVSQPVANRDFINYALPVRLRVEDDNTFRQLLSKMRETLIEATANQNFPCEVLPGLLDLPWPDGEGFPLFDVSVSLKNIHRHTLQELAPNMMVSFEYAANKITGLFSYNAVCYRPDTIERLSGHYLELLAGALANPDKKISTLELLTEQEKEQILVTFNDTAGDFPGGVTVDELIDRQAEQTPGAIAVVYKEQRLSYAELKVRTGCLAVELKQRGLGPDQIAAVISGHTPEMIVILVGILKSGAAYLPIDPTYPQERIDYILNDSGASIVINEKFFRGSVPAGAILQKSPNGNANLAYIIYTSGSTGKPKGVMIDHRAFIDFTTWAVVEFEHRPGYQVLLSNSYASDGAIQQIFPPLISGGTLHLIDKELRLDVVHYLVYLKTHKINNIDEVPILMKELVAQFDPNDREEKLPDLTCLSLGSEHVPIELVKKCRQHLNHRGRIINAYGPAEASVETTTYHCDGTTESEQSLIGKPRRNTRVYILDETEHLCPIGVRGEICISGVGLARGYLNRPELTAERFNRSYKSYKTYILYKTGDRGCWLADGNIRFFGRIDDQIKIRGYRVELQEIEIVLKSYNSIKDAIVLTRENNTGESEICAYYVSETGTLNKPSLREYIEKRLPSYMIPAHLLELEKIPLTPNGKVDKNALPGPVADSSGEYLPPRTEIEKKLVEIWENVLGVKKIGINDNFFAVGGDSIKTIQIASRLNTAGYRLQMKDIFNYPTISQLASLVKLEQSTAEQSEVTGTIPLTPVQRWFFEEPFPAPHHFNQAVMFYAPEGFDKQILINVFTRIQEHHDILRATYRKNPYNKEIIQIIDGGDYPLSFREYDLKKQENSLTEFNHKINEIQAGIELENGPLMKLGLFHLDDGDRLLIVIHHLAIDGVSWRILFEDIETLYSQYKRGEKPVLPPKTGSFKQWSEKLSLYADSKTFLKEKIYWAQLEEKSVPEIKKDFEIEANIEKDIQGLSFTLDQEETNLLLTKVNRAYKTEINDILLTALGLGIKKAFSHDRLLVALEGHGREEILEGIDINRTVGWFTSVYPVMLDMCHMGDPGRQIKEIKETLRRIPNKGMGYGILKYLTAAEHKKELEFKLKPQISFNYLGQFDADVKKISFFQIAKESPGHSQSLNNRREYLFDVGGMIANKRLTMTISYNQTHFKPETVAALSNHFEAELKSLIAFCSTREKTGPTPADFTYKGLSIETVDRLIKEYPGLEDIYTLTPMQEGMLFHALIDEKSSSYFEQTSYRLEGELNIALVEKSLNELFKRHDILRTAFVHKESERRVQVVLCDRTVDFYYEDISKIEEKENFVHEFKIQDKARSFDLSKETLMRVGILKLGNSEYEFTWSFHHILMDGWCVGIINSEFFEIYNSYLENRPYRLPQLKPYRTYIEWLEKQDKEKSAEYWKNYLYSYEEQVGVPKTVVMKTQASEPAYKNEQVVIILDREKTAHLEKLAAVNHVTLNIATQVIWGILLGKYNGKEDVVFGAVVSGRPFQLESVESILGLFINTVPVRIKFTEIMEFRALLQKVQEEALAAEPYHYSPLAEIQAGSVLKQNLIDHLFIFENYPIADQIEGYGDNGNKKNGLKLKLTHIDVFEQTNYDFNIILAGVEKLRIVLRYNGHVYDNNYVKKIAEHLNLIIDHVIANPSTPVVDIEIISEATKKELLNYFNENLYEALAIIPIQSHLANAFLKYSANTACEYGTIHLTYARLEHRAGCISQWLRNHNIPVGSFIGIYIEAKTDIIAAIIGILQRGCIFVPLGTALPGRRVENMVRLTNMRVIVTD